MALTTRRGGGATLVIYDSRIKQWTLPGGMVWRWTRRLAEEISDLAKTKAPIRTGDLVNSIGFSATPVPGPGVIGSVRATSDHALYVLKGTSGSARYPGRMHFTGLQPTRPGPAPMPFVEGMHFSGHSFAGQRANNFLDAAKVEVLAKHGII